MQFCCVQGAVEYCVTMTMGVGVSQLGFHFQYCGGNSLLKNRSHTLLYVEIYSPAPSQQMSGDRSPEMWT